MKALVTGASSGIGRDMAEYLSNQGYELILTARRKDRLEEVQRDLKTNSRIICADLSDPQACIDLYEQVKDEKIDVLINNAGFGLFGAFDTTDLQEELRMMDTNIKAVHILTKLFLKDMKARDSGYILNVASSAAFQPGPLLSSYYASKAYVLRLTQAVYEELRRAKSHVSVSALCPGPVRTEFDSVAGVRFSLNGLESRDVAAYALKKMFARKLVIVPGIVMKLLHFSIRLMPDKLILRTAYRFQHKKESK
jgi:short-subunit dehydrogenase